VENLFVLNVPSRASTSVFPQPDSLVFGTLVLMFRFVTTAYVPVPGMLGSFYL
jgi:hypothetical protein